MSYIGNLGKYATRVAKRIAGVYGWPNGDDYAVRRLRRTWPSAPRPFIAAVVTVMIPLLLVVLAVVSLEGLFNSKPKPLVPASLEPPGLAEILLCIFAKKRYRNGLLQCHAEVFFADLETGMSLARAKRRYWASVMASVGPQVWPLLKRTVWSALKHLGVAAALADLAKHLF